MKRAVINYLGIAALLSMAGLAVAKAASAVLINYGVVEGVQTVEHKGKHAGGALAGEVSIVVFTTAPPN